MTKHLSPANLRQMADGKAVVLLSASMIKELADYIEAMPTAKSFADLRLQRDALLQAATQTVEENLHLADGENCTLIHNKRGIEAVQKQIKDEKCK